MNHPDRPASIWLCLLISILLFTPACTQARADQITATQPVQTQPADTQPATDPTVIGWLDRIDTAGRRLKTLQATLRYEVVQGALGDKQIRAGKLYYEAKKPAKFAVHFDRLLAGRRLLREDRWYIFDGRWLAEKIGDQKQFIKREIVDPASHDQSVNPLANGQGPFTLPVTLAKDQVLRKYDVKLIQAPAVQDEPDHDKDQPVATTSAAATVHLRLTPFVVQRGQFSRIDLWYDTTTLLPTRVQTLDETENQTTVILSNVIVDEPIEPSVFDTTPPRDAAAEGWTVEIKPWVDTGTSP